MAHLLQGGASNFAILPMAMEDDEFGTQRLPKLMPVILTKVRIQSQ
jgi:hypothetical protein